MFEILLDLVIDMDFHPCVHTVCVLLLDESLINLTIIRGGSLVTASSIDANFNEVAITNRPELESGVRFFRTAFLHGTLVQCDCNQPNQTGVYQLEPESSGHFDGKKTAT